MNAVSTKKIKTSRLFPRTSFLTGMGSVLNISGRYFEFNYSKSPQEADLNALASDWNMVGQDFRQVLEDEMQKVKQPAPESKQPK